MKMDWESSNFFKERDVYGFKRVLSSVVGIISYDNFRCNDKDVLFWDIEVLYYVLYFRYQVGVKIDFN
jgi:hypothetical protein